jgi:hypothetical protein
MPNAMSGISRFEDAVKLLNEKAAEVARLRAALEAMVEEKADYMRLNHLGDPEAQHTIRQARAALAPAVTPPAA